MKTKQRKIWPIILLAVAVMLAALAAAAYFLIHNYSAATCTEPAVCSICGKEQGPAVGHQWTEAACETESFCKVCGAVNSAALGHDWSAATCTEPAVCSRCGASSAAAGHDWLEVTCAEPATCSRCGETIGKALEHSWIGGTCTEPPVCEYCGESSGIALGHDWQEATATAPRTCGRCGITDGSPLPAETVSPNVSVEAEVETIRAVYNEIVTSIGANAYTKQTLSNGADAYYDGLGALRCVIVYRGTDGIGVDDDVYSRTYYYDNGRLIFAFYEGDDAHRFYFHDGQLMRWRYQAAGVSNDQAVNYDYDGSAAYLQWEQTVLAESGMYS